MAMYTGIHHVSLVVTDIERAKHFYGSVLGLEEVQRPAFKSQGAWYQVGPTHVHLIVSKGKTLRGTNEIDDKDGHFAIRVQRMQDVIDMLTRASVPYTDNPASLTGWHQVYITDPDGNQIEFNA